METVSVPMKEVLLRLCKADGGYVGINIAYALEDQGLAVTSLNACRVLVGDGPVCWASITTRGKEWCENTREGALWPF